MNNPNLTIQNPSWEAQDKIVDHLKNDPLLSAVLGDRIYNYQPHEAIYPCLFFKTLTEIDNPGECMSLYQEFFLLHIFSEETDQKQIKQLAFRVRKLLKDHDLTLPDATDEQGNIITKGQRIWVNFEKTSFVFDDDGMTECVCEFNFTYTDNEA